MSFGFIWGGDFQSLVLLHHALELGGHAADDAADLDESLLLGGGLLHQLHLAIARRVMAKAIARAQEGTIARTI